jgi:hypothetical protein
MILAVILFLLLSPTLALMMFEKCVRAPRAPPLSSQPQHISIHYKEREIDRGMGEGERERRTFGVAAGVVPTFFACRFPKIPKNEPLTPSLMVVVHQNVKLA